MADVRSLLRAERANRRITHPNATYTSDGKLHCKLCETLVKSEAAWTAHLHSTGHTLRTSRQKEAAETRGTEAGSKKRKARSVEDSPAEDRKRAKAGSTALVEEDEVELVEDSVPEATFPEQVASEPIPATNGTSQAPPAPTADDIDAAELAAFERELADLENTTDSTASALDALNAGATISAAPLTAEEVAAQAREEQSAQRGKRDAEIEAEREDAAERLQEEFEEMEGYEARVRRLRERREALRKGSMESASRAEAEDALSAAPELTVNGGTVIEAEWDGDEDDDDDDDFDEWGFGGT